MHVIGPDELHEDVDNSAYTNYLGAWTMRWAAELVDAGVTAAPEPGEPARWRDLADRMVILRTPDGLMEQSEGFLSLPLAGSDPADRAEMAWQRDRMEWRDVKQADVVMLMALLEREFSVEERRGSYDLYEPLTRHLSSLSEAVHSLVARRVGLDAAADDYFTRAVAIDLYRQPRKPPEGPAHGHPGRPVAGGGVGMCGALGQPTAVLAPRSASGPRLEPAAVLAHPPRRARHRDAHAAPPPRSKPTAGRSTLLAARHSGRPPPQARPVRAGAATTAPGTCRG